MKLVAAYPRVVASLTVKQIEAKIANLEIAVKHASQKFVTFIICKLSIDLIWILTNCKKLLLKMLTTSM